MLQLKECIQQLEKSTATRAVARRREFNDKLRWRQHFIGGGNPTLYFSKDRKTPFFTMLSVDTLDTSRSTFGSMTALDMWAILGYYNQEYAGHHIFATDSPVRIFTWKLLEDIELPVLSTGSSSTFTPEQFCDHIGVEYKESSELWDNYHTIKQIQQQQLDVKGWVQLATEDAGMGDEICLLPKRDGTVPIEIVKTELPHEFFQNRMTGRFPEVATTPTCVTAQNVTQEILLIFRRMGQEHTRKRRMKELSRRSGLGPVAVKRAVI